MKRNIARCLAPYPVASAIVILLMSATPASAQVSWRGAYAGVDVGVGFKTQQFGTTDGWFAGTTFQGSLDPRANIFGHAGFDFQVKQVVLGGEAGVGRLGYSGEMLYGPKQDTKATTAGGVGWTAMGRIGWAYRQVMPYFAAGMIGSQNTASIVDECNSGGCGTELGQGAGTTTATKWAVAYGVQIAATKRIAGRGWGLRIDWMQVDSSPIANVFQRDVTGPAVPGSITVTNTVRTPLSNTLRVLFDIRLTRN